MNESNKQVETAQKISLKARVSNSMSKFRIKLESTRRFLGAKENTNSDPIPLRPNRFAFSIAETTIFGTVILVVFAFVLTWVTYLFLNNFVLASSIDHYREWNRFSQQELSGAYLRATGLELARPDVSEKIRPISDAVGKLAQSQRAIKEIRERLNVEIAYEYDEVDSLPDKYSSDEYESLRSRRLGAIKKTWQVEGIDEESLLVLIAGELDDPNKLITESVKRRSENSGKSEELSQELAEAALRRPISAIVLRWGYNKENSSQRQFVNELVVARTKDDPLHVFAALTPYVDSDLVKSKLPNEKPHVIGDYNMRQLPSLVESDFRIVNERTVFPFAGLRPVEVNVDAAGLAGRFFDVMNKNIKGVEIGNGLLSEQDFTIPKNQDEEFVKAFIGELLDLRIGKRNATSSEGSLEQRHVKAVSPQRMLNWRRVFNGSDAFGSIQYLTVFCFYCLLAVLFCKWHVFSIQRQYLHRPEIFNEFSAENDLDSELENRIEMVRNLQAEYRGDDSQGKHRKKLCMPLEIMFAGCTGRIRGGYKNVPGFVGERSKTLLDRNDTEFTIIRYLAWALPSIGFVGTVLGIGNALLGTSGVLSEDKMAQQASIQGMGQTLGTAFDTTFIALILSIFAVGLIHIVTRSSEMLVHDAVDSTIHCLVDPSRSFDQNEQQQATNHVNPPQQATTRPRVQQRTYTPKERKEMVSIGNQLRYFVVLFLSTALLGGAIFFFEEGSMKELLVRLFQK